MRGREFGEREEAVPVGAPLLAEGRESRRPQPLGRGGPGFSVRQVVVGDVAADRYAAAFVQQRDDRFEDIAADVLEVDVDAVGNRGREAFGQPRDLVVETGIETEFVHAEGALRGTAGDAHGPRPVNLRELPHHLPDGAARRAHDDRLAGLYARDVQQSLVCGEPGHPQHADRRRSGPEGLVPFLDGDVGVAPLDVVGRGDAVLLPAVVAEDEVAGLPALRPRLDDLGDRPADDGPAQVVRGAHARAHVGVEAQPTRAQEHLAGLEPGQFLGLDCEVRGLRHAFRRAARHYPAIGRLAHM